ncbi:MAG: hypothetical protein LBP86_11160 [Azoarcus sp.]|jgi:hypothetical protein|nr:hypothetical protein [Azoarcus sp.]
MAKKKSLKEDSSGELFTAKTEASPRWLLASNHLNLSYMLAAGLVMGPRGFGKKYYGDSLSRYPGWILLFRDRVPRPELEYAVRENPAVLKACVATLDLHDLGGPVRIIARGGEIRDGVFPLEPLENDVALLIRAPLPVSRIVKLSFSVPEDKKVLEDRALDVSNVELSLPLEIDKALFAASMECQEISFALPAASVEEDRLPARGQVTGGILAMLYHMANRGETGVAAFRAACGQSIAQDVDRLGRDPILAELGNWLAGQISQAANLQARLFWGVVDAIIEARRDGLPLRPIEQTFAFLENQLGVMKDEQYRPRLERLLADMRQATGFLDSTVTGLLERHKGSLSRPLLLFCLRESCEELLEFSHPLLNETEFLLAAILFGARDGWLGMPRALRQPASLSATIAYRMAEIEQRQNPVSLRFPAPERPKPLRELFVPDEKDGWSRKQQEAALELARKCKWTEAIQTRISLGKGDYRLAVEPGRLDILLEGDVKAVTTEVVPERFLQRIGASHSGIEAKIEKAVREHLGA